MYNRESTLKNFCVIQKLGKGSFSSVYKVQRLDDKKYYAMKKVKIGEMRQKQKQNALNQVRILASITHPNIVNYKQAFFDDNTQTLCVVMQLADAGDIQKKVNQHLQSHSFFTQTEIWQAFVQMTRGLKALHDVNILHRDLKCANVFCTQDGKYKLGDMNVSKVAKRGMAQTQTGTPYYTSPQVWKDKPYDSKCDIWSLGCVIYEMAALKPPFRASNLKQLYSKIQRGLFERIPPFYSDDLQNIINSCLKVNPLSRPSTNQILQNSKVLSNLPSSQFYSQNNNQNSKCNLLKTIQVPKNLKSLKQALPKSKYQNQQSQRPLSQKRYERANSANNFEKPKVQVPRVITTPKVEDLKKNQIKYALMRRPSSSSKQPKSQCRQIPNHVVPTRISRNNSVDSIKKRQNSNNSSRGQALKQKLKVNIEDISNRCKQIQARVQGLINRKKDQPNSNPSYLSDKRVGVQLPRVNSRQRIISANRQYQNAIRQKSIERALSNNQKSIQKYIKLNDKSQQKQNEVNKSLDRQNSARKKYMYGVPPKIR